MLLQLYLKADKQVGTQNRDVSKELVLVSEGTGIFSGPSRPSSQHKGDLFPPEGQRSDKRQSQGIGEVNKGKGTEVFIPEAERRIASALTGDEHGPYINGSLKK